MKVHLGCMVSSAGFLTSPKGAFADKKFFTVRILASLGIESFGVTSASPRFGSVIVTPESFN